MTLSQQSLEKTQSIQQLEEAAVQLYKALQAGRDTGLLIFIILLPWYSHSLDMAATMERLQEYRTHNSQFCKRMLDFLSIMFVAQVSCFGNYHQYHFLIRIFTSLKYFLERRLVLQDRLIHDL